MEKINIEFKEIINGMKKENPSIAIEFISVSSLEDVLKLEPELISEFNNYLRKHGSKELKKLYESLIFSKYSFND
jgi:hypothetical protein